MELLFLEEKEELNISKNSLRKTQEALSWPKRVKKGYLESERRMVKSAASHHEKSNHCNKWATFCLKLLSISRPVKFLIKKKLMSKKCS